MGIAYRDDKGNEFYDPELKNPVPMKRFVYPALTGRFKRRLNRQNTVHLRGICPKCGKDNMKWYKDIPTNRYKDGKPVYEHSKWVCKNCNFIASREDLEYVKFV